MSVRLLQKELRFFEENRRKFLRRHRGQYALVKGEKVIAFVESAEAAYLRGVELFGRPPFLIKEVCAQDRPVEIPALSSGIANARS